MNLRKIFNIPNKEQKALIKKEIELIEDLAEKEAFRLTNNSREYAKNSNNICSHCRATEENIVNKIQHVKGEGKASGSFMFGTGSIYGDSHVDTSEVRHCNKCGNQWKIQETRYTGKDEVISNWMNHIEIHIQKEYSFGTKTVEMLQKEGIHAESIHNLLRSDELSYYTYSSTKEFLKLRKLRTVFKSIYVTQ